MRAATIDPELPETRLPARTDDPECTGPRFSWPAGRARRFGGAPDNGRWRLNDRNFSPVVRESLIAPERPPGSPLVYVVDDMPQLTDLYALLLARTGRTARVFNHRSAALRALKNSGEIPDLLITDYLGPGIPVQLFLILCLTMHPHLRILMATGFPDREARRSGVRHVLQKPFTIQEFESAVSAALDSNAGIVNNPGSTD